MPSREEFGSWLTGRGVPRDETSGTDSLGLPTSGPGSPARIGRRVVALVVDWAAAGAISYAFFSYDAGATLAIFFAMNLLLVSTVGTTLGHRLLGLQVRRLGVEGPHLVGFGRGAIRAVLVCLVIPAVVWDTDGRGLHDKAAGTVIVRR
ncbi:MULTISPECIES: RDD family protein [Isoptericola]|uniref:RDD family protein n=1 Tax=Isoptericola sediminis TaxID=2733572 RepID=A0A849K7U8_9MICO|nr:MULTISPECIES: RDD family protein [Isoptericola]MDO8145244.1 RDD family protein [Isoptericola sp. 178]MDO8148882.1 RDD family protein [Isoptericola sp. b515]MDO8151176.1 RDD family protein [Isoptericola sp. b408]NNU28520.1 RDD family protein [Isoptericola sediminis]